MECLIISGMSGAGKSLAADVLEDIGYYCIDNMPVSLIPRFIELFENTSEKYRKVALVVDARSGSDLETLCPSLEQAQGISATAFCIWMPTTRS